MVFTVSACNMERATSWITFFFSKEAALPDVTVLKCSFQQRAQGVISATSLLVVSPSDPGDVTL